MPKFKKEKIKLLKLKTNKKMATLKMINLQNYQTFSRWFNPDLKTSRSL